MTMFGSTPLLWLVLAQVALVETKVLLPSAAEVRADFLKRLDRPRVPLDVKAAPAIGKDGFAIERLTIASERKADGSLERIPMLVVKPNEPNRGRRPAVIVLHGTGGTKERMKDWLDDLARLGIIGVAIDARYHGDRSGGGEGSTAYVAAITRAWRSGREEASEHPFYYDTCWDLWRTVDYLQSRPDVDPDRIGMIGTSMGGIQTWLAAAVDDRVKVAVPAIAVQSFHWGLENNAWQGRANTIKAAHEAAAKDLGEPEVNPEVCRALWTKLIPGILDEFDGPSMLRLFAGRPMLILNGELDPNCPINGARLAFVSAQRAYRQAGAPEMLKIDVASGVGHRVTDTQRQLALDWFVRWLKP